jgi:hypothetical protein
MAITASGLFGTTFINILTNVIAADLGSETGIKLALISDSATPDFNAHDYWNDLSANEVTGTGWSAGGVVLTSTALSMSSGTLLYDAADVSQASTTLTNAMAAVVYDDSVTTPTADAMLCLVDFVTAYSTSNGTFAITWSSSPAAIFTIDMTP